MAFFFLELRSNSVVFGSIFLHIRYMCRLVWFHYRWFCRCILWLFSPFHNIEPESWLLFTFHQNREAQSYEPRNFINSTKFYVELIKSEITLYKYVASLPPLVFVDPRTTHLLTSRHLFWNITLQVCRRQREKCMEIFL